MSNTDNAGKTVEQIIAIKAWEESRLAMGAGEIRISDDDAFRIGYIKGYTTAQQSQPMWREIEEGKLYTNEIVKDNLGLLKCAWNVSGTELKLYGYTYYLSSDDLLRLPIEKK